MLLELRVNLTSSAENLICAITLHCTKTNKNERGISQWRLLFWMIPKIKMAIPLSQNCSSVIFIWGFLSFNWLISTAQDTWSNFRNSSADKIILRNWCSRTIWLTWKLNIIPYNWILDTIFRSILTGNKLFIQLIWYNHIDGFCFC